MFRTEALFSASDASRIHNIIFLSTQQIVIFSTTEICWVQAQSWVIRTPHLCCPCSEFSLSGPMVTCWVPETSLWGKTNTLLLTGEETEGESLLASQDRVVGSGRGRAAPQDPAPAPDLPVRPAWPAGLHKSWVCSVLASQGSILAFRRVKKATDPIPQGWTCALARSHWQERCFPTVWSRPTPSRTSTATKGSFSLF